MLYTVRHTNRLLCHTETRTKLFAAGECQMMARVIGETGTCDRPDCVAATVRVPLYCVAVTVLQRLYEYRCTVLLCLCCGASSDYQCTVPLNCIVLYTPNAINPKGAKNPTL